MHDDGIGTHELEHDDVIDDRVAQLACHHGRSAILDDDRLSRDVLDPGQRVEQHAGTQLIGKRVDVRYVNFVVFLAILHVLLLSSYLD